MWSIRLVFEGAKLFNYIRLKLLSEAEVKVSVKKLQNRKGAYNDEVTGEMN